MKYIKIAGKKQVIGSNKNGNMTKFLYQSNRKDGKKK
jgi:hypothetical protein